MSRDALTLLVLAQAEQLAPIAWGWPPAATLVEEAMAFARGQAGMDSRSSQRIGTWARRWARVHPRLREFYARHADAPEVSAALWAILAHYPTPNGPTIGRLYALWEGQHGSRPGFDMFPKIT